MMFGGGSAGGAMIGTGIAFYLQDAFSANADKISGKWKQLTGITEASTAIITSCVNKIKLGFAGLAIGAALVAPFVAGLKVTAKLEDQLADVRKTTGMTADEAERLKQQLFEIDTRTDISDLIGISAIGGQVGVAQKDILAFTESVDKLSVALGDEFTGGAEEVSKTMGQLRNIFSDIKSDDISADLLHIGNAINELGAAGFATGPVVSDFANRIGGIGIPLGLTTGQVLGLSATLQELNVNAERGGSAVGRIMQKMLNDVDGFAKIAGVSANEFRRIIASKNPEEGLFGAFKQVVQGTSAFGNDAVKLAETLDQLGLDGIGTAEVFMKLRSSTEMLDEKVLLANGALGETSSILGEFNTKNTTFNAQVSKMQAGFKRLADTLGKSMVPLMKPLVNLLTLAVNKLAQFANTKFGKIIMTTVLALGLLTMGMGAFLMISGKVKLMVSKLGVNFLGMSVNEAVAATTTQILAASMRKLMMSIAPLLVEILPLVAALAVIAGVVILAKKSMTEFNKVVNGQREAAEGWYGVLQKIGGILTAVQEIWASATEDGFSFSKKTGDALNKLGIFDFVVSLGTWLVRLKAMFSGVADGLFTIFKGVGQAVMWVIKQLDKLAVAFGFESLSKNLSDIKLWIQAGKILGYVIGVILVAAIALITLQFAFMILAMLPIIIIIGLIIAVIYYWNDIMDWIGNQINNVVNFIVDLFWDYVDFMFSLPGMFVEWGVQLVDSIWQGILSSWGWLKEQFLDLLRDLPGGSILLDFFGVGGSGGEESTGGGMSTGNGGGSLTPQGVGNTNFRAGQMGGATNTTTTKSEKKETKEVVKSVNLKIGSKEFKGMIDEEDRDEDDRN